ncbi:MAG: LamG domain-containing protein [Lentisphaerae bacterium]|nr:LamG domain-containing protein [Lentisphaerota bacterium]
MKSFRLTVIAALTLSALSTLAAPWNFPARKGVEFRNIPDWGKAGFTLEVWAKPAADDCGYAVLMRGSFGYPNIRKAKNIDCYLVNSGKKNSAGRVYTALAPGKYHYYVLTGDPEKSIAYRDGKLMRTNKVSGIPVYNAKNTLHIGHSLGWANNFKGEVAVVRIHNRALTAAEIKNNYAALQNDQALPQDKSLIFNEDRRELANSASAAEPAAAPEAGELTLSGVEKAPAPDNAWTFPAKKAVKFNNIPNWGNEGFALEVYCQPDKLPGGYAVLMRGSFGFPNFYGAKNIDCYLINNVSSKNAAGRVYTALTPGKYHYYVLTGDPEKSIAYRDGKALRTNNESGIPKYDPNGVLNIGNSLGWNKNFTGKIALVRIHKKMLSAEAIRQNWQALQNNQPLANTESVIFAQDRRVTGNFYKFTPEKSAQVKRVPANTQISLLLKPEKLLDSNILSWGKLNISSTAQGDIIVKYGQDSFTVKSLLSANSTVTLAFAWNGTEAGLFADGKAVGKLIKTTSPGGSADLTLGGNFAGIIGKIMVKKNEIMPPTIGKMVSCQLDNRSADKVAYPRSRHLSGKVETIKPLVTFDDLTNWQMSYTSGAVKPVITRSKEEPLWSDYVLRTEFAKGDYPSKDAKVVLTPPEPIKVTEDFDTVAIWRFATAYGQPRPALSYSIQYKDAAGKLHCTGNMGGMLENGWGIHMKPLKNMVKAPAEIVSITFSGFNEDRRVTYFDSLHVYKRPDGPLEDCRVLSYKKLGVPTREETILPTAGEPAQVTLSADKNSWQFTSVSASGKKLLFKVEPKTGTLSDISADYNGQSFKPMNGGGFYWALDNVYPVKSDSLLAPNSSRVKARLQKSQVNGKKLTLEWLYTIDGQTTYPASWTLEVIDNTLIVDLKSPSAMVGEFKFGAITGISGKVIEIPYLNLGRWIHPSNPPGIFAGENIYISSFVDWYNSDASGLFGESSSTPGGKFVLNLVTADHRWVADPNAGDPSRIVRDVSVINGGSYYWPKTDGKRNPARDRIMVTISDNIAAVLPNIPNPRREYLATTAEEVWATRMWYCKLPYMSYFDEEFAQWQEAKDYGMEKLNVRLHGNINRMYHPRRDGGPSTFIKSFTEPQIGGDAKLAEFFERMRKLDYRIGIYTDHMLLNPVARDAWDPDMLNLDSNGNWLYSSGNCKQTKMSRMVDLQKKFNALYKDMFKPTCAYLDQITCPPCWRYTDYDARTPDAGKFSAAYRVMVESLRAEEADFGPVLSEGKTQMFFAGLCDSYAQPQRMYMNVIPDFNLRKLHTMSNDCGYELGWINYKGAKGGEPQKWSYKLLAYQYAYGNTGHIFGNYHGAPLSPLPDYFIRSYFLVQPAQKYYALTPVKSILYNVNGLLKPLESAVAADTLDRNQVKIVYANGLEVAVNLNDKENFTVTLHGKEYVLPPEGFAAYLPGKLEAYSALNKAGKRSDLMQEGNLIYCAGITELEQIQSQYDYTLRTFGKTLELTPAPFKKPETVTLKLPFDGKAAVTGIDRQGKQLTQQIITADNGKLQLPVDGKVFRYVIKKH